MEVQISWLEAQPKKTPPRMPGAQATVPPMPVAESVPPETRNTIPVEDEWLEIVDDGEKK